jgi:protein-S-isoprenylcysteine O-methyltransferase Ste14
MMMRATGGAQLKGTMRKYFFVLGVLWLGVVPLSVPVYFSSPNLAIGMVFIIAPFGALIVTLVACIQMRFCKDKTDQ